MCTKKDRRYCHSYIFKSWRPKKAKKFFQTKLGKKPDRVSPLESFSVSKKQKSALETKEAPLTKLKQIFESTRKYLELATNQPEVFDALSNLDAEIDNFRKTYYPGMSVNSRFEYEDIVKEVIHQLEVFARRKLRQHLDEKILSW